MHSYHFKNAWLPYLLLFPQLLVTIIFFFWPAFSALEGSFFRQDAFGLSKRFVGFQNFTELLSSQTYLHSFFTSFIFAAAVTILSLSIALILALACHKIIRNSAYKSILIWPYAVAPAVAGIMWRFLFDPSIGILAYALNHMGLSWNYLLNGHQALALVVFASCWQQVSYNFIFFLAGLMAIPRSILEAAAIDGAGPVARFFTMILPLLSPMTFFLLVMNLIYAFFETFGVIAMVTEGGPSHATNILVYKVFYDGFYALNVGSSDAQSVILMLIVVGLTVLQFRYLEKRVHY